MTLLDGSDADALRAALVAIDPRVRVRVVDATDSAALHVHLAATGPHDVVIDATSDSGKVRAERARRILLHVRRGGLLVVLDAGVPASRDCDTPSQVFVQLLSDAFQSALEAPAGKRASDYSAGWGKAVESVTVRHGHLVISNGLVARAKVREEQAGEYLALRGKRAGRVLLERPGSVVENSSEIRMSDADDATTYSTRFEAPPLQLRVYRDATCWPGQVVTQRGVLLPETYRHCARPSTGNRFVDGVAPDFGRVSGKTRPTELSGAFFHLDSEFRGHFGHALTEQIARLWAWEEAKREEPALRALVLTNRKRTTIAEWEYQLYEAAGIPRSSLVLADGPVRVERLLTGTPMFSQPEYVHAGITDVYRAIGDRLAAQAPDREYSPRIFCSRRLSKRSCHNTPEVEAFFADRGFEIVYPEDHPLGEQVQMFRRADDIAGFGGSGMFTMAFVPDPRRVFLVSSENYRAQNEALMAAVHGHQINVAWCRPDKPRAAGFKGPEAMHSRFTFDAAREGRFLASLLDEAHEGAALSL